MLLGLERGSLTSEHGGPQGLDKKALANLMHRVQSDRHHSSGQPIALRDTLRFSRRLWKSNRGGAEAFYLERLSPCVVGLVCFVVFSSALDALFTLMYLQQGGNEANPLMAMALDQGMTSFVTTKMALTGLGTVLLAIRHHCWLGLRGLYALAVLYAALLVYHAILYTIVS
jgi:hypothetical protein